MKKKTKPCEPLNDLESQERSLVLSFLELSERKSDEDQTAEDELAFSLALKSALKGRKT